MSVMIATFAAGSHIPPAKGKYEYAPPTIGRGRAVASVQGGIGSRSLFSPEGNKEDSKGEDCGLPNHVGIMNICSERLDGRGARVRKCQRERERKHQEQNREWCAIEGETLVDVTNTRPLRHRPPICSNRGGRRGGRPIYSSGVNSSRSRLALRTVTPSSSCISRNESRHVGGSWTMNEDKGDQQQMDIAIGSCLPSDKENWQSTEGIEGSLHKPNALAIVGGGTFLSTHSEEVSPLVNDEQKIKGDHDDVLGEEGEAPFGEDVFEALEAMYDEDEGDDDKRNDVSVTAIDPMPLKNALDASSQQDRDDDKSLDCERDMVGCSFLDIADLLADSMSSQPTDAENNDQTRVQHEQNKSNNLPPFDFHQRSAEERARNVSSSLPLVISGCSTDMAGDVSNCQTLPIVVTPSSEVCPNEAPSNCPSKSVANTGSRFCFGEFACLATAERATATPLTQNPLEMHSRSFQEFTFALPKLKRSMQDEVERCKLDEPMICSNTDSGTGTNKAAEAQAGIQEAAVKEATVEDDDDKAGLIAKRRAKSAVCAFGGNNSGKSVKVADIVDRAHSWRGDGGGVRSDKSHTKEHDKASRRKRQRVTCKRQIGSMSLLSCSIAGNKSAQDTQKVLVVGNDPDIGSNPSPRAGLTQVSEGKATAYPCKVPRYRCSQCGLPKQNHVCSVESSLHRSIGVMVYPAINAFTSHEDGLLAPPLSKMNNFLTDSLVSSLPSTERLDGDISPGRRCPSLTVNTNLSPGEGRGHLPVAVTPESSLRGSSSSSSTILPKESFLLSTERISPLSASTPLRTPLLDALLDDELSDGSPRKRRQSKAASRSWVEGEDDDGLFVAETVELRPEQFRTVTTTPPSTVRDGDDTDKPYQYPSVPLPHGQRKRFYDALIKLSVRVGGEDLRKDCDVVLREARSMGLWDLAVAELLTQVVVAMYCPPRIVALTGSVDTFSNWASRVEEPVCV